MPARAEKRAKRHYCLHTISRQFEAGRTYEFSPKNGRGETSMQKFSTGGKYVFNHISNGKCRIYVFRHKSGRYTESFSCVQLTDFNVRAVGRQ